MLNLNNLLALTLTALVGIFSVLYLRAENARQADQIGELQRAAKADQQLIADQAKALAGQQALQVELGKISASTRKTEQTLSRQSEQLARDLEELKRTDETVEPYLRGLVPVAVGLRYERPETTDPLAYRQGGGVRTGAVPAVGAPGAGHE
ncbi:hypothetical protein [Pseudomonas aeruginosa]|uniref:hypothetical protein n=1 Tax=Pseudomonas aeruginosa TaxID=287 RepID=UPI003891FFD6